MILVINRRANYDYVISKKYQAGIVLSGAEVKSLRQQAASLKGSFVKILDRQAYLINAQINAYPFAINTHYDPKRSRKLLLKKKEIFQLMDDTDKKGWTIVPLSLAVEHNKIKLNLGVGKGKKEFEKRDKIKQREQKREIERRLKNNVK